MANLIAQIDFLFQDIVPDDPIDIVHFLLSPCYRHGNLTGEPIITVVSDNIVRAYAYIPAPDALEVEHLSTWGREGLEKLEGVGCTFAVKILGIDHGSVRWQDADYLVLFARMSDGPISDQNGTPISTFLLPIPELKKEKLYSWSGEYNACDHLWLNSGNDLELSAYKQLADPRSSLNNAGRGLCADVAKATRKPTYYYLLHHFGDIERERERPCPVCGFPWFRSGSDKESFWSFSFRCDTCFLLSNWAYSFDEPEKSKIGSWESNSN